MLPGCATAETARCKYSRFYEELIDSGGQEAEEGCERGAWMNTNVSGEGMNERRLRLTLFRVFYFHFRTCGRVDF